MTNEGKKQELQQIDVAELDKAAGGQGWDTYGDYGGYGYGGYGNNFDTGGPGNQVMIDNGGWYFGW